MAASGAPKVDGIEILAPVTAEQAAMLSTEAQAFLRDLVRKFGAEVKSLLKRREADQARYDAGELPDFLSETQAIRDGDWRCAPQPEDLLDRRAEITGPVDRKMIINALNSGANCFMADFEDSNAPTWSNCIQGQVNLLDANKGTISFEDPKKGKKYALGETVATLLVRPRGWHLLEKHVQVDGEPVSASLFDFGLYFFHNAKVRKDQGKGCYFYLPKLQSHTEAKLWNDVFVHAQDTLGFPVGTCKGTVLIETLPAAFEMNEILHALKDHSAGLNCGRWDYIFSVIKTHRAHKNYILPDRDQVGMTQHNMRSYTRLVVQTCHRRGVHAMGGMAAQIPIKGDEAANAAALAKVKTDKEREAKDGHDGTWVAHPGLVATAKSVFDAHMPGKNQLDNIPEHSITRDDLLALPEGTRTEAGLRKNLRVGLQYIEAWLGGNGCVPLYNLMEDAATAEISRSQVWQWLAHGVELEGGITVDAALIDRLMGEEAEVVKGEVGAERFGAGKFAEAQKLYLSLLKEPTLTDFLTLPAYESLLELPK